MHTLTPPNTPSIRSTYRTRGGPALLVAQLMAVTILLAWSVPAVRTHLPSIWHLMTASTSIGIFSVAACLLTSTWIDPKTRSLFWAFFSVTAALIIVNTMVNLSLPLALLRNPTEQAWGRPMALQTAMGLGLLLISAWGLRQRWSKHSIDFILMLSLLYCLVLSNGYIAGAQLVVGQTDLIKTSPHTLVALWLLWLGAVGQRRQLAPHAAPPFTTTPRLLRTRWQNFIEALRHWL